MQPDDACFWASHYRAEIGLVLSQRDHRSGIEFERPAAGFRPCGRSPNLARWATVWRPSGPDGTCYWLERLRCWSAIPGACSGAVQDGCGGRQSARRVWLTPPQRTPPRPWLRMRRLMHGQGLGVVSVSPRSAGRSRGGCRGCVWRRLDRSSSLGCLRGGCPSGALGPSISSAGRS